MGSFTKGWNIALVQAMFLCNQYGMTHVAASLQQLKDEGPEHLWAEPKES